MFVPTLLVNTRVIHNQILKHLLMYNNENDQLAPLQQINMGSFKWNFEKNIDIHNVAFNQ